MINKSLIAGALGSIISATAPNAQILIYEEKVYELQDKQLQPIDSVLQYEHDAYAQTSDSITSEDFNTAKKTHDDILCKVLQDSMVNVYNDSYDIDASKNALTRVHELIFSEFVPYNIDDTTESFLTGSRLTDALLEKKLDCEAASMILADISNKLDIPTYISVVPQHVFITFLPGIGILHMDPLTGKFYERVPETDIKFDIDPNDVAGLKGFVDHNLLFYHGLNKDTEKTLELYKKIMSEQNGFHLLPYDNILKHSGIEK